MLKRRSELENFSGKTAKAVKQDFHAKIYLLTLSAAYAHPVGKRVRPEFKADKNRKHDQKINQTNANSIIKGILLGLLLKKQYKKALKALKAFDDIVFNTRVIIRPRMFAKIFIK